MSKPCVVFYGAKNHDGYGFLSFSGRVGLAHRMAYSLFVGPVRAGFVVRHSCNNPACIEVSHLALGSASDNTQDMVDANRQGCLKLDDEGLRQVRCLFSLGISLRWVADAYGMSEGHLGRIRSGKKRKRACKGSGQANQLSPEEPDPPDDDTWVVCSHCHFTLTRHPSRKCSNCHEVKL